MIKNPTTIKTSSNKIGAYNIQEIAKVVISEANTMYGSSHDINRHKLQRILFFTQVWHLKENSGARLFNEHFYRWENGPACPSIHYQYALYGDNPITYSPERILGIDINPLSLHSPQETPTIPSQSVRALIRRVLRCYGSIKLPILNRMLCEPGGVWLDGGGANASIISIKEMGLEEY